MPLNKIFIKNFRCFTEANISLSPGLNFFYGDNGVGKTSLLEAVYMLSGAKSFKSSNISSLIKYNCKKFNLKAYDGKRGHVLEIEKAIDKPISILLNNKRIRTTTLKKEFPCNAIHNDTFSFASAAPDFRRKLLDRAIFIADERFSSLWFSYYRTLRQRNAALKNNRISDIYAWNEKIVNDGTNLTEARKEFFNKSLIEFKRLLNFIEPEKLFEFFEYIEINFYQGWDNNSNLLDVINHNSKIDLKKKITTSGPHKSDIKFLINGVDAKHVLSRGEQKLFSILWSCAQNEALKNEYDLDPTLLIDDIKSELDKKTFEATISVLKNINNQVIFSCIDDNFSSKILDNFNHFKKFHVEHLRQNNGKEI